MRLVRILAAALVLCAAAAAGCGLGPGKDQGDVTLTVTRDYGSKVLLQKSDSINESDTVFRVLDRNADVSTRYGGGFVQSVNGLAGSQSGGRSSDWFFYVNGIESPIGSAQYDLSGGDRVWWDYRDWTAAMRVPAVVGSWPEPFVHGFQGKRYSTEHRLRRVDQAVQSRRRGAALRGSGGHEAGQYGGEDRGLRRPLEQDRGRIDPTPALPGARPKRRLRTLRRHQEAPARTAEPAR